MKTLCFQSNKRNNLVWEGGAKTSRILKLNVPVIIAVVGFEGKDMFVGFRFVVLII